jgi:hypothetical protein
MKNWQQRISPEEKLDVISQLVKGEQIIGILHNVRLAHSSICTIRDNAERITDSVKCVVKLNANNLKQKASVCTARLPQCYQNEQYHKLWICVSCILIALEINKYVV